MKYLHFSSSCATTLVQSQASCSPFFLEWYVSACLWNGMCLFVCGMVSVCLSVKWYVLCLFGMCCVCLCVQLYVLCLFVCGLVCIMSVCEEMLDFIKQTFSCTHLDPWIQCRNHVEEHFYLEVHQKTTTKEQHVVHDADYKLILPAR